MKHVPNGDEESVNIAPTNTTRTELHYSITRTRVAQELEGSGLHIKNNCYPRVMSHSLPHLTDTDQKFSLTSCLYDDFTNTLKIYGTRSIFTLRSSRQSDGSTQIPILTGYELKLIETTSIETKATETEVIAPNFFDRKYL